MGVTTRRGLSRDRLALIRVYSMYSTGRCIYCGAKCDPRSLTCRGHKGLRRLDPHFAQR